MYQTTDRAIIVSTYKQLEDAAKKQISDYKTATVETVVIPNHSIHASTFYFEEDYRNCSVYVVTFQTESWRIDGDIIRLVDPKTKKVIGYNYRE